jgi:3-oxoacyl-[acyl-carrier-protein] synthase II
MRAPRRVVVTGLGTVNALATGGAAALSAALASGRSGIAPVRAFDVADSPSRLAAEVDDAALARLLDPDVARRLSRIGRLTVTACRLALADAGITDGSEVAIVLGTEHGDFRSSIDFATGFLERGIVGLSPMLFPNTVMNAMAGAAAIAVGAKGPSITLNQATVAGDLAVARAAALVAAGHAAVAVAGGVDEVCGLVYRRLAGLGALSPAMGRRGAPEGARPYAPDHNGPVRGEGATFVVLEWREAALSRGATLHAEVLGSGWGNVPVAPHTAPAARRDGHSPVRALLDRAGVKADQLSGCYGAGNGDPGVDDWELALLEADLGAGATGRRHVPPRSLSPVFGEHGGLGALRVAAAARDCRDTRGPVLVHGIARGGCRTAVLLHPAA